MASRRRTVKAKRGRKASGSGASTAAIEATFEAYKDPAAPNKITTDGIVQFCEDAGVDLAEQVEGLVLLWALGQEEQLTLTKNQFVKGMAALNCTTAADIKKAMPSIVSRAYGSDFKSFYKFAFKITTPKGRKNLLPEEVHFLMPLVLAKHTSSPLLATFLEFFEQSKTPELRLDEWQQFPVLIRTIKPDLSDYDEDGAWPVLFDEFVDWYMKRGMKGKK